MKYSKNAKYDYEINGITKKTVTQTVFGEYKKAKK